MIASIIHVLVTGLSFWLVSRCLSGWQIKTPRTAMVIALAYAILMAILWSGLRVLAIYIGVHVALLSHWIVGLLVGYLAAMILSFCATIAVVVVIDKAMDDFSTGTRMDILMGCVLLSVIQLILRWFLGLPMIQLG